MSSDAWTLLNVTYIRLLILYLVKILFSFWYTNLGFHRMLHYLASGVPRVDDPLVGVPPLNLGGKIVVLSHLIRRHHYAMIPKVRNTVLEERETV